MSPLNFASTLIAVAVLLPMAPPAFAAPRETAPVFLAELKLRVCDADYAGTGSGIKASLKNGTIPWTKLDYPRNDFQRGTEFTYVLSLDQVETFADIESLTIMNQGTDQLCLDRVQLIVNRSPIFERLGEVRLERSNLWIDYFELRGHPLWLNWRQEFGGYFNAEMLRRIVAAGVGTGMELSEYGDYDYSWYGTNNPVITPRDKESFNVHIELEFRQRCLIPMTQTYTYCRLFVLSGDFVLGVTCLPRATGEGWGVWGYIEERGVPMAGLITGMSRYIYELQWASYTQANMLRIVETTAKAFGRQPDCKVFQL